MLISDRLPGFTILPNLITVTNHSTPSQLRGKEHTVYELSYGGQALLTIHALPGPEALFTILHFCKDERGNREISEYRIDQCLFFL